MRPMVIPMTVLFVSVTAPALGQAVLPESAIRLSLESEVLESIGNEAEAGSLIQTALAERFGVRLPPPAVVNVIAEQLPERWLPRIEGVRFERLPLVQAQRAWTADCLPLFWITATVTERTLTLGVSEGDRCHSTGTFKRLERTAKGWEESKERGGFGGYAGECPCGR